MKVLFVASGNSEDGLSPIVRSQGKSLQKAGADIAYFPILGKGLKGYLRNVFPLAKHFHNNRYDIIHAHYSLSALIATLAGCKPLVVSLMGSDIRLSNIYIYPIKIAALWLWDSLIVKSSGMRNQLAITKSTIIPNGVNLSKFRPLNKGLVRESLGWDRDREKILFAANPSRLVKNFQLLEISLSLLSSTTLPDIHVLENITHEQIPIFMNAADVVVLTSLFEGSPNVIKEAMACNCPIVATDVGDVRWVLGNTPGCYVASFDPEDVAVQLNKALEFARIHGKTSGRDRIVSLGLDSETVARKLMDIYSEVLETSR